LQWCGSFGVEELKKTFKKSDFTLAVQDGDQKESFSRVNAGSSQNFPGTELKTFHDVSRQKALQTSRMWGWYHLRKSNNISQTEHH